MKTYNKIIKSKYFDGQKGGEKKWLIHFNSDLIKKNDGLPINHYELD